MLSRIRTVTESALNVGSLTPLETQVTDLAGNGQTCSPSFQIRLLRKDKKPRGKNFSNTAPKKNPFLPYDPALYVEHLPPSHVLLLNKYPVVAHHTLIVTSAFEHQSTLLTLADHTAMWRVIMEFPSLAFYNAGPIAGASQPHKHLQVVHTPDSPGGHHDGIPFDTLIYSHVKNMSGDIVGSVDSLPFVHAVAAVDEMTSLSSQGHFQQAADLSMQRYIELMNHLERRLSTLRQKVDNVDQSDSDDVHVRPFPYNFLCTRRWMMVVPRRQECFGSISVNALGFAGFLLVRDEENLEELKRVGGIRVLSGVTFDDDTRTCT